MLEGCRNAENSSFTGMAPKFSSIINHFPICLDVECGDARPNPAAPRAPHNWVRSKSGRYKAGSLESDPAMSIAQSFPGCRCARASWRSASFRWSSFCHWPGVPDRRRPSSVPPSTASSRYRSRRRQPRPRNRIGDDARRDHRIRRPPVRAGRSKNSARARRWRYVSWSVSRRCLSAVPQDTIAAAHHYRGLKSSFGHPGERAAIAGFRPKKRARSPALIAPSNAVELIIHGDLNWVADTTRQAHDVAFDHAALRDRISARARARDRAAISSTRPSISTRC